MHILASGPQLQSVRFECVILGKNCKKGVDPFNNGTLVTLIMFTYCFTHSICVYGILLQCILVNATPTLLILIFIYFLTPFFYFRFVCIVVNCKILLHCWSKEHKHFITPAIKYLFIFYLTFYFTGRLVENMFSFITATWPR